MSGMQQVEEERSTPGLFFLRAFWWQLAGLACVLAMFPGCGSGGPAKPYTVKVKGSVKYKGAPLTGGDITFVPVAKGTVRPGTGSIDSDGEFIISSYGNGDGVEPGAYKVVINPPEPPPEAKNAPPKKSQIPPKYQNITTTPLKEEVDAAQVFDFDLED